MIGEIHKTIDIYNFGIIYNMTILSDLCIVFAVAGFVETLVADILVEIYGKTRDRHSRIM